MYRRSLTTIFAICVTGAVVTSGTSRTSRPARSGDETGTAAAASHPAGNPPPTHDAIARYGDLPLSFERNEGQRAGDAKFLARGRGYELVVRASGAALSLERSSDGVDAAAGPVSAAPGRESKPVVTMSLVDGRTTAPVTGVDRLPGHVNYLLGTDATRWRTGIPTYRAARVDDVYRGIDVVYYGNQGELEYDFLVEPGADPKAIALRFDGIDGVRLTDEGDLLLQTRDGELRQHKPVLYQEVDGQRRPVEGRYALHGDIVTIVSGEYDRAQPLVIDPVLVYSGYTGDGRRGEGIDVDATGHAYVAGWTSGSGPRGKRDGFVMKINPTGTAVVYTTYVGGTDDDYARDVAVDAAGAVHLTGYTRSADFPLLQAFDITAGLAPFEPFVTKLAPDGTTLVYSSYLGADSTGQSEIGTGIEVHNGNAYVVGYTDRPGFPTTPDAFQPTKPGPAGTFQAFFAKVGPTGALLYSTYLGGTDGNDYGYDVAVDAAGSAYLTGRVSSRDFPTRNAIQTSGRSAFVTKLSATGALVYSTYLGGTLGYRASVNDTEGHGIAVDASGSAYVTGFTQAINFPTTPGAYDLTCDKQAAQLDCYDAFVSKLNPGGTALVYSTYLGGSAGSPGAGSDTAFAIAVDAAGRAYVTGRTRSTDFPVLDAFKSAYVVDGADAFVSVLNPTGTALVYSSYLGGATDAAGGGGFDEAYGIALDQQRNAYVTGHTLSSDFPIVGGFSGSAPGDHVSNTGGFVTKISAAGCVYSVTPTNGAAPPTGGPISVNVTTAAGCGWGVSSAPSWLTAVPGSGTGSGTVTVTASRNSTVNPRIGQVTVAGMPVTVTQPGGAPPPPTNCTNDTDCDGLPTAWEIQFGLDPTSPDGAGGAGGDPDNDGRTNAQELAAATHPRGLYTRYFAEGATGAFFDLRIALLNPGASSASALLRFLTGTGSVINHHVTVNANTRATVFPEQLSGLTAAEFSTVIESDVPLVADRTMTWNATGYGSHAETSLPAPTSTWYLAEGATHSGFSLFYLIQNPGNAATTVQVTYLLPAPAAPIVKTYSVAANSRFNIWVNQEGGPLASTDVSAVVSAPASTPIIVERAMYRDAGGQTFGAGHNSAGIATPSTDWFLAEGATGDYFDLFVLIANPNAAVATVTATYLLPTGQTLTKSYNVGANSRFNIWVDLEDAALANTAVSTTLTSSLPVIVERSMWWPNGGANWFEAHNSPGATGTGTRWALAEGEVGGARSTDTYVLIANTSAFAGSAAVTLLFEDGTTSSNSFPLAASSRFNVDVRSEFPQAVGKRFGVLVESVGSTPAQIVVERAMYSNANGVVWAAGTNALGTRLQ